MTGGVRLFASYRQDDLANVDACDSAVGLPPGATHAGLQTIGTSAGKHLVDAEDVEGVDADAEMEGVLARRLGDVLVGTDAGGFKSLG